ncbi:family 27 putative glycoside hydrolase [Rhypophila decipiens]|uniref:Alpha-galactosidase n=1 Tax=Rhypophila decipiens TaxID=261697 RepID=A0AAN7B3N6_9PEZI|nr:family 27 putative glycoside hydrolase [Rhypophila decipiens]
MTRCRLLASLLLYAALSNPAAALVSKDGTTGRLPAMGWNSWNEYACNINEDIFLKIGQRIIDLGLKDAGYEYVNIDDCWSDKSKRRDPKTKEIIPDATKFPRGISYVASKLHSLGLKVGIYSDAGTNTCGGYAGSLGYEDIDASTFSKWGIDYLKYDNCDVPSSWADQYEYMPHYPGAHPAPANYDYATSNTAKRYNTMREALLRQNRTLQYSLCAWGHAHVERWGNNTGHSWRGWGDIRPTWDGSDAPGWNWGLMPILDQAAKVWNYTGFWGRSDWDMLEVGNGNLTIEENRSHFALWCALRSPLIIGARLADAKAPMKQEILDILKNRELIAFNQDNVYGASARPIKWDGKADRVHPASYWVGRSVKGVHLFMVNTYGDTRKMEVRVDEAQELKDLAAGGGSLVVHDMWSGKDIGTVAGGVKGVVSIDVKSHDTAALRISAVGA